MVSLLDYLSAEVNCVYVSDLKNSCYHQRILALLRDLEAERFVLLQWQEAINYIFNLNKKFDSVSQIKTYVNGMIDKL